MGNPLLHIDGVTLQYRTDLSVTTACYRVNFEVFSGDRFIVMGHSGCGKSTILNAIAGFMRPVEGKILFNGHEVQKPNPERMVVWQSHDQLLPWKSVLDNITFPILLNKQAGKAEAEEKARHWLKIVGLERAINQYPHELSGGMKMRAAIARGFAYNPKILLMDEPYAALDALTRLKMQDELIKLQSETGTTILFVTHDINEAVRLGTRILVLSPHPGQVLAEINGAKTENEQHALAVQLKNLIFTDEIHEEDH